ncbi:cilia- and flagella-associated protein 43 [Pycnococcus provasolii]
MAARNAVNLRNAQQRGTLLGYASTRAPSVVWLDDDSVVYTVGNCVSILNVTTGEQNLHEVSATAGQAVRAFAVTTGKQRVLATVSAYQEPMLCITKLATGATIVEVPAPGGDLAETTALAFSADGKRLAALCAAPVCKCHILDAATGATLCSADLTEGVAAGAHGVLAFHPTRSDLVAVAGARTCRILRFPQGLETHPAWYVDVDTPESAQVGADTSSVWWDGDALLLGNSVGSVNILPFAAGAPRPGGGVAEAQLVAESFVGDEAADAMDTAAPNKCVFVAAMEGDVVASVHPTVVQYWRRHSTHRISDSSNAPTPDFDASHTLIRTVPLPRIASGVGCAALSPSMHRLAVGAEDGVLQIITALDGELKSEQPAVSADGTTGQLEGDDALNAELERLDLVPPLPSEVAAFAFEQIREPIGVAAVHTTSATAAFVVAGADGSLAYYTVTTVDASGTLNASLDLRRGPVPSGTPRTTRVASSGRFLAVARIDGLVTIIDAIADPLGDSPLFRGKLDAEFDEAEGASSPGREILTLAFAPGPKDGERTCLACVSADGHVYLIPVAIDGAACAGSVAFPTPPAAASKRLNLADKNLPRAALPRLKCGTWLGQKTFAVVLGVGDLMQFDIPPTCLTTVPDESTVAAFEEAPLRRRARRLAMPLSALATSRDGTATLSAMSLHGDLLLYPANSFSKCDPCAPGGLGPARRADDMLQPTQTLSAHGVKGEGARSHTEACVHGHHLGAAMIAVGGRADTLIAVGRVDGTLDVCRAPELTPERQVQPHLRSWSYAVAREGAVKASAGVPAPPPRSPGVAGVCFVHPELVASVAHDGSVYLLPVGAGATSPPRISLGDVHPVAMPVAYGEVSALSNVPSDQGGDTVALDATDLQVSREEYAGTLNMFNERLVEVRESVHRAVEKNSVAGERERLDLSELVVNEKLYKELADLGEQEVQNLRHEVKIRDTTAEMLRERIQRQCWDTCAEGPGYQISPLFDETPNVAPPVWSFPVLKKKVPNARHLQIVSILRQVECMEVAARPPVDLGIALTMAEERASIDADSAESENGTGTANGGQATAGAAGAATTPSNAAATKDAEAKAKENLDRTDSLITTPSVPIPEDALPNNAFLLAQNAARARVSAILESGTVPKYHEYELYVPHRCTTQALLLLSDAHAARTEFNATLIKARDQWRAEARDRLVEIADKAHLAVEELHIIGGEQIHAIDQSIPPVPVDRPTEDPKKSVLHVRGDEVTVRRVLSAEQKREEEIRLAKEEEERRQAAGSDIGRRGVNNMMHGTLIKKKEGFVDIKREEWMDEDRITWTDEQKKLYKEYENRVKEQEEEKEKIRRQLEGELRNLREEATEVIQKFDVVELRKLRVLRAEADDRAAQCEMTAARLASTDADRTAARVEYERLKRMLAERQATLYAIQPTKEALRSRRNACAKSFEEVVGEEQMYERNAKKELLAQGSDESTAAILLRNFKKKTGAADDAMSALGGAVGSGASAARGGRKRASSTASVTALALPDDIYLMLPPPDEDPWVRGPPPPKPAECDDAVYEIFTAMWEDKASLEQRVRETYSLWYYAEAEFTRSRVAVDTVSSEVNTLVEEVHGLGKELARRLFDLDVAIHMKQGIDEVEKSAVATDYGPARFIDRAVTEDLNHLVLQGGGEKVEVMRQLITAKKSIYSVAWESRQLDMREEMLKELLKDLQLLRLNRDVMNMMIADGSEEKTASAEEDIVSMQITFSANSHARRIAALRKAEKKHSGHCESMNRDTIGLMDRMTVVSKVVEMRREVVERTLSSRAGSVAASDAAAMAAAANTVGMLGSAGSVGRGSLHSVDETRPSTAAMSIGSTPASRAGTAGGHAAVVGGGHAFSDLTAGLPMDGAPPRYDAPESAPSGAVHGGGEFIDKETEKAIALQRRHREVSATRKLREIARAQEMELVLLRSELDRLQKRSFPSFSLAPRSASRARASVDTR